MAYMYAYFCSYYYYNEAVCDVDCYGYEDKLEDCYFNYCDSCANEGGTVGITCSKQYID